MPYCTRCGAKLPEDEEARFCPNCGAPIPREMHRRVNLSGEKRKKSYIALGKSRFLLVLAVFFLSLIVTSAGALSGIDESQAHLVAENFEKMEDVLHEFGVQMIFGNNMMYCLLMFVPFVGPIGGFYVLYSTGKVLAALSYVLGADPLVMFLSLLIYPHAWLEYISYSIATSEGILLSFCIWKYKLRGLKAEAINVAKYISICAVLLLLGAAIEMALITLASSSVIP